ncbi:MAG: hypothetical protein R2752_03035 [Vicinamibacterales bacterium]
MRRLKLIALLAMVAGAGVLANGQVPQSASARDANLAQLAAEAAGRGPAMPIPLLGEGTRQVGAVYDRFVLGVLIGRAELAAGRPADPAVIAAHPTWQSRGTVVVAYPVDCEGRPNQPLDIRWKTTAQAPVQAEPIGEPMRGEDAGALLPGTALPPDARVVNLRNALLVGAWVEVDYAGPVCRGAATTMSLPVAVTPTRGLSTAFRGMTLPADLSSLPSPTTVWMHTLVDPTGRARFPERLQGPAELQPPAIAALEARRFQPATINGVPMPLDVLVPFVFTTTGEPTVPERYVPAPPTAAGGNVVVGSTVGAPAPSARSTPPPVLPPAPPGQNDSQLARLAVEVAGRGVAVPIPLDPAGPARHGVLFDRFLMGVVKARAAIEAGAALEASTADPALVREDAVAVAFPLACDGRTIAPSDVLLLSGGTRPGPVRNTSPPITGADLQARLPGVALPEGAVGRAFASAPFGQNLEARVTYAEAPCGSDATTITLPIQSVRGAAVRRRPSARIPDGVSMPSPITVVMRGLVDLDGRYRFPTLADGPKDLEVTAVVTASDWQFQPYRANGVPTPAFVLAPLVFTTTGAPGPPGRGAPPPDAPPVASPNVPPVAAASSRGGRSTEDLTTPDEVGLSASTSQCAIARDTTYGFTPVGAVKTGGGPAQGPARELRYLGVLRGPDGQGLHIVRRGSVMAPDGETILDLYEITYAGLDAPLRIYLDEYHDGLLQAPAGLVCAQPIAVR